MHCLFFLLFSSAMSHIAMTRDAIGFFSFAVAHHPADHLLMAVHTIMQYNIAIKWLDLKGRVKIPCGERYTVIPSIDALYCVFPGEVLRCVTAVAGCNALMA